jgi:YHS domain-containing protein
MNNQEKLEVFLENLLQERLIFFSKKPKDLSKQGRMFFIQETKIIDQKEYYVTKKSKYYPRGLIQKKVLIDLLKKNSQENVQLPQHIKMNPVGMYMGSTHCRCCKESLGNGSGSLLEEYQGKKYYFSLTGGADHYLKHGIHLNLISYFFHDKEKNIREYVQFVGNSKDIFLIEDFIKNLTVENKSSNQVSIIKKMKI